MKGLLDKLRAILRRDLLIAMRYRSGFLLGGGAAAAELAAFYFLSRAIGPAFRPQGLDYFSFLLVGTGFYTFMLMSIHAFLNIVQQAQQAGTLEVLMTSSTRASTLIILSAVSAFAGNAVQLLLYIGGGLFVSGVPARDLNIVSSLVVFLLSLLVAVAIGIFAATLQLTIQKGSAVVWLMGSGAWFMTGTLFPVTTLPPYLRDLSQWIPLTHSLNAMRMALLDGVSLWELRGEIGILTTFAGVLLPLSILLFSQALKRARLEGTLSSY
ncbi:MAG TPA: ABC transporter permease [Terriglobales bacterium]|jgi:ABC-2 type transport system permease protein